MKLKLFCAAVLTAQLASAATPVDGWYSSVFGGYSYLPDNTKTRRGGLLFDGNSNNGGYNAGIRLGYQGHPLRYEGEYSYIRASTKHFHINTIRQKNTYGYSSASLLMANIYYDFPEMVPCIEPFLGLGIGYGHVESRLGTYDPVRPAFLKVRRNLFTYQGTAGLTYNFAENYAINLAYRYFTTARSSQLGQSFQGHLASVGAIYRFDESSYK